MNEIVDKLEKMVVYIEDKYLYAINKNHTLLIKHKLKKEYPSMGFSTSNWVKGIKFLKVDEKHIVFKNRHEELIKIPNNDINLKKEYETLEKECKKDSFVLNDLAYKLIQKYKDTSSFFRLDGEKNQIKVTLYDTSKDRTIENKYKFFNSLEMNGTWYLPTDEINTLYKLGFNSTNAKVSKDKNYILLEDKNSAIVSSMRVVV